MCLYSLTITTITGRPAINANIKAKKKFFLKNNLIYSFPNVDDLS